MKRLTHWILFISIIVIYQFQGSVADTGLWCLECSWSDTEIYTTNGTNTTGDPLCIIANLDDITAFPPNPPSPIVNPLCTYDSSAYKRLLEGPCYDYGCYAQGSKACVKWTTYKDDVMLNITRLCAVVGSDKGCFHQSYGDGFSREVCICDDQHFCNSARTYNYPALWFSIGISLLLFLWHEFRNFL